MRTIEHSATFKQDYRRIKSTPRHRKDIEDVMKSVIASLSSDQPLPSRYRDHGLIGDWAGYRECHIKPDLLLIYKLQGSDGLRLARIGSHADLFS